MIETNTTVVKALIVSWLRPRDQGTKGQTMSVIELSWTAKKSLDCLIFDIVEIPQAFLDHGYDTLEICKQVRPD